MKIELVNIERLIPYEGNPRIEGSDQVQRITQSLKGFGFVEPVIAYADPDNKNEKLMVVVGHQRLKAAHENKEKTVPVIVYPFKDKKMALAYNIASNRLAELSEWDMPKLKDNIEILDDGQVNLELTGFGKDKLEALMIWTREPAAEKNIDENIETSQECPKCGYKW